MRRVEQYELMRRDYEEGLGVRAIARKYGVHRRRVREAIESAIPSERKVPERACPVLVDPVKSFIEEILMSDRTAPRKQRHTAHRIWQRVREELGVAVAESTAGAHVSEHRREPGFGQGFFVPHHHETGAQAAGDCTDGPSTFTWRRDRHPLQLL